MQPNEPDKVWISREEYERLRTAAQTQVAPQPTASSSSVPLKKRTKFDDFQIAVGVVLAVALYLSLTTGFLNFLILPVTVLLMAFAVYSWYLSRQATTQPYQASPTTQVNTAAPAKQRSPFKIIFILLLALILAPIVYFGGLLLFFIIAFSSSGQSS